MLKNVITLTKAGHGYKKGHIITESDVFALVEEIEKLKEDYNNKNIITLDDTPVVYEDSNGSLTVASYFTASSLKDFIKYHERNKDLNNSIIIGLKTEKEKLVSKQVKWGFFWFFAGSLMAIFAGADKLSQY